MFALDEAITRVADAVFRDHRDELVWIYCSYPTLAGSPRKTLSHILSHNIRVGISGEIKRVRRDNIYPLAIENAPVVRRIEREVFRSILSSALVGMERTRGVVKGL